MYRRMYRRIKLLFSITHDNVRYGIHYPVLFIDSLVPVRRSAVSTRALPSRWRPHTSQT